MSSAHTDYGHYEIAPYSNPLGLAADIVSSSILGFGVISAIVVLSAIYQMDNKNKLRARMLIALFASHLWAGAVFLGFIVTSLAGHPPANHSPRCYASAFLVESAIWCQYLFTIVVAIVSYCILLHPHAAITLLIEKYWYLIDLVVCLVAFGMATLQTVLYGAVYIGGFCWNGSEGNVFNELIGCVPRVIVFIIILTLDWKINWFLRRQRLSSLASSIFQPSSRSEKQLCDPSGLGNQEGRGHAIAAAPYLDELGAGTDGHTSPWETLYVPGLTEALMLNSNEEQALEEIAASPDAEIVHSDEASSISSGGVSSSGTIADSRSSPSVWPEKTSKSSSIPKDTLDVPGSRDASRQSLSDTSTCATSTAGTDATTEDPKTATTQNKPNLQTREERRRKRLEETGTLHELVTRKAALLFLLFPLTYAVLTIVSLARLIDDYVDPTPSPVMRAISRWTLFLQGPLDALTYGVIAFKIKKEVGKEIRRRWLKGEHRYIDHAKP